MTWISTLFSLRTTKCFFSFASTALHVNGITTFGTPATTRFFVFVFFQSLSVRKWLLWFTLSSHRLVCTFAHPRSILFCVFPSSNSQLFLPCLHYFNFSHLWINTLPLFDQILSSPLFLFQIMVLSGKCFPLSISPRGAAFWRRLSCSRPGRDSRSEACWSCTAAASFMWVLETRSSRSRWRDAATTRAESEYMLKLTPLISMESVKSKICIQQYKVLKLPIS